MGAPCNICENEDNALVPSFNALKKSNIELLSNACNLDVIVVCETWFNDNVSNDNVMINGFNEPYRCDRADGYGGVAIFASEGLDSIRVPDFEISGLENVCIKITTSIYNIYVLGIYRSPSLNAASNAIFLDKFETGIKKIKYNINHNDVLLIGGDLNVHCNAWFATPMLLKKMVNFLHKR